MRLKAKEFCNDPAFKASVGFLLAASPMRLTAPRMMPSMKRSKATTPKKMKWMKNLIRKAKMSHKLTSLNVQFTTENKWLL